MYMIPYDGLCLISLEPFAMAEMNVDPNEVKNGYVDMWNSHLLMQDWRSGHFFRNFGENINQINQLR